MSIVIGIDTCLNSSLPIVDVRSPAEFHHGHIPGAFNVPIFEDGERADIGTTYKQCGRRPAVALGLKIVGGKADDLIAAVAAVCPEPDVAIHCWRGGMRSEGFAWLLEKCGWNPQRIRGGYKAFRRWNHEQLAIPQRVVILGGKTGAGKTRILQQLQDDGQQVIDLEGLACHRGSAFGSLGQSPQPTVEQFENNLFFQWRHLDADRLLWLEGESRAIGRIQIPAPLWHQMGNAPMVFVEADRDKRVKFLVEEYGYFPPNELAEALERIQKRLGGIRLQQALRALEEGDVGEVAGIALDYYDKAYVNALEKKPQHSVVKFQLTDPGEIDSLDQLIQLAEELTQQAPQSTA